MRANPFARADNDREDKWVNTGTDVETVTLWRPTGPKELALVEASGWREWPPRLPEQPFFYPVLNEDYATMIARDWNVNTRADLAELNANRRCLWHISPVIGVCGRVDY